MRPSNPTNIVIQNKYVEVTERDLYNFWIQSKENILKNVTNNVFFYFSTKLNKSIVRRYEEKNKPFTLSNFNYENKLNGHIVGIVSLFDQYSNFGIIDIDAPGDSDEIISDSVFNNVKQATLDIYSYMSKFNDCKIIYTGKNGFHIYVYFQRRYTLNTIKKLIQDRLSENDSISKNYTMQQKRGSDKINLDLNINKTNGGFITLGSINKIGLRSVELSKNSILNFNRSSVGII